MGCSKICGEQKSTMVSKVADLRMRELQMLFNVIVSVLLHSVVMICNQSA